MYKPKNLNFYKKKFQFHFQPKLEWMTKFDFDHATLFQSDTSFKFKHFIILSIYIYIYTHKNSSKTQDRDEL